MASRKIHHCNIPGRTERCEEKDLKTAIVNMIRMLKNIKKKTNLVRRNGGYKRFTLQFQRQKILHMK